VKGLELQPIELLANHGPLGPEPVDLRRIPFEANPGVIRASGEALTSHFPLPPGVDLGCVSVLRHDQNPSPSSRLPGRGRAPQALRALTLFSSVILEIVGMVLLGSAESPPDAKQATAPGMPSAAPTT
jgi:hypothetical protein